MSSGSAAAYFHHTGTLQKVPAWMEPFWQWLHAKNKIAEATAPGAAKRPFLSDLSEGVDGGLPALL